MNNTIIKDPVAILNRDITYTVTATTAEGCTAKDDIAVKVFVGPEIYVPNAFTPNNDMYNNTFKPLIYAQLIKYEFRVFNRWGQLIFSTKKFHDGWDGKLGGTDQQSGIYVWMIEGITKDDRVIRKQGTVALIR